jgi:SAM-dependent methyltransferase
VLPLLSHHREGIRVTKLYTSDAELYDIAFEWDIEEEVDWLLERLGGPNSVLEPGCGSGRMLEPLLRRGIDVTGIDLSPEMIELARARLHGAGEVCVADMADFDLGRTFDGAICPINTVAHLTPAELGRHLECMARHLVPGGRYLAQVGLMDRESWDPSASHQAEASRGETKLRWEWADVEMDFEHGFSRQRSRIWVLEGPRAGDVVEDIHDMTLWMPDTWAAAIAASPFDQVATHDAGKKGERPLVGPDATGGLLWHELVLTV